jgi:hypothetical protein
MTNNNEKYDKECVKECVEECVKECVEECVEECVKEYNEEYNEEEYDEEEYNKEIEKINKEFPDANNFSICVDYKELDNIISKKKQIIIKHTYECYCYENINRSTEYFKINDTKPITNRKVIEELCIQNFNPDCNHVFLECISKIKNSIEYELHMGS